MVVEVVTLQPSHHDKDLIRFHLKQLAAGRMIKVDSFLRSAFHTQRADKGKMCEEPFHLGSGHLLRQMYPIKDVIFALFQFLSGVVELLSVIAVFVD